MPKTAGIYAVSEAFHFAESRIRQICREPYLPIEEMGLDAMKRIEPSYYSLFYGLDSHSGSSSPRVSRKQPFLAAPTDCVKGGRIYSHYMEGVP